MAGDEGADGRSGDRDEPGEGESADAPKLPGGREPPPPGSIRELILKSAPDPEEMKRRQEEAREEEKGASFASRAAAIGLLAAVVLVAFLVLRGGDSYTVTAHFENASQLVPGNNVVVGGSKRRQRQQDRARRQRRGAGRDQRHRRRVHAAAPRDDGDGPFHVPLPDRRPPDPAHPAGRLDRRARDRRRRRALPGRDGLRGRPRRGLQHPRPEDDPRLQARDPGLRDLLRRRRRAGERGPQVPEPVPLDLTPRLPGARRRPARVREPDRRHLRALRGARRPLPRHLGPGRKPRPDDERDRRPQARAREGDQPPARLHALREHDLRQPPRRAR